MVRRLYSGVLLAALTIASSLASGELGRDWVRATASAPWSPRWGHTAVSYAGKIWVIGGEDIGDVWNTADGVHWTAVIPPPGIRATYRYGHTCVVYAGKMWLIGGISADPGANVWYSTNGTSWTRATGNAPWGRRWGHSSVVYDGKMWVIGGSYNNDVWYSTNGTSWTQATAHGPWIYGLHGHASVVFDGKMWVIRPGAWYSSNGTAWTVATGEGPWLGKMQGMGAVVCDGKMWVMGGLIPPPWYIKANDVWSTRDGRNWKQATPFASWWPRQNFPVVVFNRRMWILGGLYKNSSGSTTYLNDVWYSEIPTDARPSWQSYR